MAHLIKDEHPIPGRTAHPVHHLLQPGLALLRGDEGAVGAKQYALLEVAVQPQRLCLLVQGLQELNMVL